MDKFYRGYIYIYVFLLVFIILNQIYYKPNYNVIENKSDIYKYISKKYLFYYKVINKEEDLKKIKYPVVMKPDDGYCGIDVKLFKNSKKAIKYYRKNRKKYVVQKYHPGPYEIGLYYIRIPYNKRGYIWTIVSKKSPTLIENERWEPLMCATSKSCNRRNNWITPRLTRVIDRISRKIPNFYIGRYDIRFSNLRDLKKGKNFMILELNTTNASPTISNLQNYKYSYCQIIKYKLLRLYIAILTRIFYYF